MWSIQERDVAQANAGRVLRGGSWLNNQGSARAVARSADDPINRNNSFGFRVCLPPSLKVFSDQWRLLRSRFSDQ